MSEFEKEAISILNGVHMEGTNPCCNSMISTLYLEPDEISMEELAKKTGYSLATISNHVSFMEHTGIVKKIRKPGSKKIFIYMEKDFLVTMRKHFMSEHMTMIKIVKEKLPLLIEKYSGKLKNEDDKKKLKIIEGFYKQSLKMEIIINELAKKIEELDK